MESELIMKWLKQGLICNREKLDLPWYKKNVMVPVPYLVNDRCLRLFVTLCDEYNVGRIGYLDVDPLNPSTILGFSEKPIIDIGEEGTFDDNGAVSSSILQDGDRLYLYYSGYQLCKKVPYMIFTGVAVSDDGGNSFTKLSKDTPILDRVEGEVSTRCAPFVIKENGAYRCWYTADSDGGWLECEGKKLPRYDLKYIESESPVIWPSQAGRRALTFENSDEHGIAKSTIWRELDVLKIIYSIRAKSYGYRLGYGEASDGWQFERKDSEVGITVSPDGWDSEMIAFAERIECMGKTYLFYCGNHYGMDGMGYAELLSE